MRAPIPFGLKLGFTAWIAFWAPVYWLVNGPANFLWLCDFANFVTCVAIWRGSARLASSQLVGVSRDGERFLLNVPAQRREPIRVLVNWKARP